MTHFTKVSLLATIFFTFSQMTFAQFFTETFDGGLPSDWMTVTPVGNNMPTSDWFHTTTGPAGDFAHDAITSTTADNGWMIFDSDLNCNIDAGQDAWLISPAIDASDKSRVFLIFQTYYRRFQDKAIVRVGSDMNDLDSWEGVDAFPDTEVNDFGGEAESRPFLNPQYVQLDLTDLITDASNFHFAFQFLSNDSVKVAEQALSGCDYSWQIDDVMLTELENDLEFQFAAVAPNYATPVSQVDSFIFDLIVANNGTMSQSDIGIDITVDKIEGTNIIPTYDYNEVIPLIEPDSIVRLTADNLYLPLDTGSYVIRYDKTDAMNEENPANNSELFPFIITDDLFAKDDGSGPTNATQPSDISGETWEIGNYFFVPNDGSMATEAIFSFATNEDEQVGQTINIFLYEVLTENGDVNDDEDVAVVAFASHEFGDEEDFDLITTPLFNLDGEPGVALTGGKNYILMVAYPPGFFVPYTNNSYLDLVNVGTVVKNGGWFLGGFGPGVTAIVRMRVTPAEVVSTEAPQLADDQLTFYPNPTDNQLNVSFNLLQPSDVNLKIYDMKGVVVSQRLFDSTTEESFNWNVNELPAGSYLLNITTDEGVKTKRFSIQR